MSRIPGAAAMLVRSTAAGAQGVNIDGAVTVGGPATLACRR